MARPDYITVTLVTDDGIAFEGSAPTENGARQKAYNLAKKRLGTRGRDIPKQADMAQHKRRATSGPAPRSF